jgi:hypothetical protein
LKTLDGFREYLFFASLVTKFIDIIFILPTIRETVMMHFLLVCT